MILLWALAIPIGCVLLYDLTEWISNRKTRR